MRSASLLMLLLAFTLSILASPASGEEPVSLHYHPALAADRVHEDVVEVKTDQILTLAGMPIETHAVTFMTIEQKIIAASPEGGWKFQGRFSRMQSDMEFPGGMKVSFNSNNPEKGGADGPLAIITDALKATAGATWVMETNDRHEIVSMMYDGDPFAKLDPSLIGQSDPEAVKKVRATELGRYPADPVKPGDTWTQQAESNLGGGQTLTLEKEYTYLGAEQRDGRTFDKVAAKAVGVTFSVDPNSATPAKVTDSELAVAASEGTLWYDREARAFTHLKEKVQVTGTLTIELNGQKLPGELDLTIQTDAQSKLVSPE